MEDNNSGTKFVYFLTGVSIGALVGILFAPKSGRETREYISNKAEEGRDMLAKKSAEYRDQATEYLERGKGVISQQKEHLAAAIEAGKTAYRAESKANSGH
ncbi:MAG: YtxH domain-containing protein [Acidobacteria bacterium]|nr:YtxH domain-containing protein [Acidobacteriota bacterium]